NEMTKLGAISKPVRTQYGYHLIKLTKFIPEKTKPFKEVKAQLEETVRRQVGEKKFFDASPDFYNIVYEQPDSLKPVADALGLKIKQSDWFARDGGKGIAAEIKLVTAAYHPDVLEAGRNSEAIEIDDTTLVSVRLLEHKRKQQKPVADVEDEIKNKLRNQLALDKVEELKQKVLSDLKNTNDLKLIAKKYKLNLKTGKRLVRNLSKDVDKRIIDQVFSMKVPKDGKMVVGEVNLGGQGVVIIGLKAVRTGDANKADKAMRTRAQELLYKRNGEGYFQAFVEDLRKRTKVKVFTNNL
ncbi:MAG: peptidyl-prolyl cis-trans isomerase, partial [Acidiferrobacterales bacterium]